MAHEWSARSAAATLESKAHMVLRGGEGVGDAQPHQAAATDAGLRIESIDVGVSDEPSREAPA
jgi:hypothetical protein